MLYTKVSKWVSWVSLSAGLGVLCECLYVGVCRRVCLRMRVFTCACMCVSNFACSCKCVCVWTTIRGQQSCVRARGVLKTVELR